MIFTSIIRDLFNENDDMNDKYNVVPANGAQSTENLQLLTTATHPLQAWSHQNTVLDRVSSDLGL